MVSPVLCISDRICASVSYMIRFELLAVLLASLLFAALSLQLSGGNAIVYIAPMPPPEATPTALPSGSPVVLPPLTLGIPAPASTTPSKKTPSSAKPRPTIVASSTTPLPIPPAPIAVPPPASQNALDTASAAVRSALVNIICFAPAGSRIRSISGSGIIVDAQGYILTDAHVAQYLLLTDQGVSCTIRKGDPAVNAYRAKIAFIPAPWIRDNAAVITQVAPSGTGERDFAILAITGSATKSPLPASFPAVPLAFSVPAQGTPVVIASYGAQFLEFAQIETALPPTIVFGSIQKIFTFNADTADVLSIGGSAASQEGSSGGGVVNASGELVGDITTSTIEGDTSTRTLSAITAAYIRREYALETGESLNALFMVSPSVAATTFAPQAPALEALLLAALAAAQ